jgi:hypothetical protein
MARAKKATRWDPQTMGARSHQRRHVARSCSLCPRAQRRKPHPSEGLRNSTGERVKPTCARLRISYVSVLTHTTTQPVVNGLRPHDVDCVLSSVWMHPLARSPVDDGVVSGDWRADVSICPFIGAGVDDTESLHHAWDQRLDRWRSRRRWSTMTFNN